MRPIGCDIVDSYGPQTATYEQYHHETTDYPYVGPTGGGRRHGPWLAAYFATHIDLGTISKHRGVHHLYFDVFQCPKSAPHDYSFDGGLVFNPTAEELERLHVAPGDHVYKVYMPVNLANTIEWSPFLHWPEERATVISDIRSSGLCVIIGGGNMLGVGLRSHIVKLPVVILDDPIAIKGIVEEAQIR